MTDTAFARAFERGEIAAAAFGHHQHLRLAWVYLAEGPTFDAAVDRIRDGIQRFAAAAGASQKYHETITVLWMRLLEETRLADPDVPSFGELLRAHPGLGDKDLPFRYYSRERLLGDEAKRHWVPPDLRPIDQR